MEDLFYKLAVLLVILWALAYFGFNVGGGFIHLLLLVAFISVLFRVIRGK